MRRAMQAVSMLIVTTAMGVSGADFLPLAPGNQWTYQDATSGQTFTVRVGITQNLLNNHVYYVLRGYTPDRLLVRVNEYGNLVFWDEFLQTDLMSRLRWMRMFGDTIFAVGALTYVLFVLGLSTGQSYRPERQKGADLDSAYAPVPGA